MFRRTFSRLLATARDLNPWRKLPYEFQYSGPLYREVIDNTIQLRNFKGAAFELAELCKLLGIVATPLLLDHVRREADKFLSELNVLFPEIKRCSSTL